MILFSLHQQVPLGLISDNWGGTPVQHWSSPGALAKCPGGGTDSVLWNAMMVPYTVGPMSVKGFTWWAFARSSFASNYAWHELLFNCLSPFYLINLPRHNLPQFIFQVRIRDAHDL